MKTLKVLRDKAKEIYPGKETFFDPGGTDSKEQQKILLAGMKWAFELGMKATIDIVKSKKKQKQHE